MELNVSIMENRSRHHFHQPQVNACLFSMRVLFIFTSATAKNFKGQFFTNYIIFVLYPLNAFKLDNDLVS